MKITLDLGTFSTSEFQDNWSKEWYTVIYTRHVGLLMAIIEHKKLIPYLQNTTSRGRKIHVYEMKGGNRRIFVLGARKAFVDDLLSKLWSYTCQGFKKYLS